VFSEPTIEAVNKPMYNTNMTRYFIPIIDKDFIMTRSKYAQFLNITVNCLKLRMRRGLYGTEYVLDNGKYLFRFPKRNGDLHVPKTALEPTIEPLIRGQKVRASKMASGPDAVTPVNYTKFKKQYNRGATHAGKTNYNSNMDGCKKANDIKALNKIRNNLGDEYTDEINDELVMIARKNVAARKEVAAKKADREATATRTHKHEPQIIAYGGGRGFMIPSRYGGFLTRHELHRADYTADNHPPVIDWSKKYYG
jgi:hypothetical protein